MTVKLDTDHVYLANVIDHIQYQPSWRAQADKEMDYDSGNQRDSATLKEMAAIGIAPIYENFIGPAMEDITGMEAKTRTDWKVLPDGDHDKEADDIALATNYKLNQAERRSGADKACTEAYASQAKVGIGFVEVCRSKNPMKFPYRCSFVHRNSCYWDWTDLTPDFDKAEWFLRKTWTNVEIAASMFPKSRDIILSSGGGWIDDLSVLVRDGGRSTEMAQSQEIERGWTVDEIEWRTPENNRVCLFELSRRRWEQVKFLRLENGDAVRFDKADPLHIMAVTAGTRIENALVDQITKSFFMGPHKLGEAVSEFDRINYVPFWGKREDGTGVPFGTVRWLIPLQDEINARISKMMWLLGSVQTERSKDFVLMTDEIFRNEIARPDADIITDASLIAQGGYLKINRNPELNKQQYERLIDLRETAKRISHISDAIAGQANPDNAGAMSQAIEQSVQGLATVNDNFAYGRQQVGDLLMSMILKDIGDKESQVVVKGNMIRPDKPIVLNARVIDEEGNERILNATSKAKLKVTLAEIPSTPSFRQMKMQELSDIIQTLPDEFKAALTPYLVNLMDLPDKEEVIGVIKGIIDNKQISEEQVTERIKQAIEEAKTQWLVEQKNRELDIKERKTDAEIEKLVEETISLRLEEFYTSIQGAGQAVAMSAVVPVADQVLKSAGFRDQDAAPIIAPIAVAVNAPTEQVAPEVQQNTSPMFPPRVQEPDIEKQIPPMDAAMPEADEGLNQGIEAPWVQL
jgi:hypothetical protein